MKKKWKTPTLKRKILCEEVFEQSFFLTVKTVPIEYENYKHWVNDFCDRIVNF